MQVKKKWQGISPYRYKDNPLEKEFALAWQESNEHGTVLDYLMDRNNSQGCRPCEASDESRVASSTVIQWLGSPVGQFFLAEVLRTEPGKRFIKDRLGDLFDEDE